MKKVNRNKNYSYNDYENKNSFVDKNTNNEDLDDYQEENYPDDTNDDDTENGKNNDYKVIDKNSKFKVFIIVVICIVLSLSLVIANSLSTRKQIGENTTVTTETVTSNVTDVITSSQESTSEVETVVYNLPPDLSVYGTWQLQENTILKIKFDKSYVYTVDSEDTKSVWTGTHAVSVCGEKALTKTGLTSRQVMMRYGVPKNKFNIDNFYYICLPYEYVSFDGNKKTKAESDFSDKLVELYLYLYNDKDGNLVADSYIPRDGESALMDQIVQIKGEEL